MGERKQFTRIISKMTKLMMNVLGYKFWCITLVLAKIIMIVTQMVSVVRVKDIRSDDISSVIIVYGKLFISVEHKGSMNSLRVRAITHV